MKHLYYSATVKGRNHARNEDFHEVKDGYLVLADGMGGECDGDLAARMAVEHISCRLSGLDFASLDSAAAQRHLLSAIKEADRAIEAYIDTHPMSNGMGTTVLLAILCNDAAHVAWCGDSHCYLYDSKGVLKSLTKDHSYVQGLIDEGKLTREESLSHPDNNIITRYVGGGEEMCAPDFISCPLSETDILLLCSDGLSGYCSDRDIRDCMAQAKDLSSLPQRLVSLALRNGSEDDITIITACGKASKAMCKATPMPKYANEPDQPKRGWLRRLFHKG